MTDDMQRARELLEPFQRLGDTPPELVLMSCDRVLEAITAALRAAPEGFVLVPVEPTPEMLQAAAFAVSGNSGQKFKPMMAAGYTAMLAASPQGVK